MSGCSLKIALEEVFLYGTVIYAVHITLVSEKMGCYVGIAPDIVLLTQCALRLQVKCVGAPYVLCIPAPYELLLTHCTLASEMSGCCLRTMVYRVLLTIIFVQIGVPYGLVLKQWCMCSGVYDCMSYEWVLLTYSGFLLPYEMSGCY